MWSLAWCPRLASKRGVRTRGTCRATGEQIAQTCTVACLQQLTSQSFLRLFRSRMLNARNRRSQNAFICEKGFINA